MNSDAELQAELLAILRAAPAPTVPAPAPAPTVPAVPTVSASQEQTVRTKIRKNEGSILIECSHSIPTIEAVMANLPTEFRRKVRLVPYASVKAHISRSMETVSFQLWADAISAAVMHKLANDAGATSEMHNAVQGGYLALGDTLYKMSAIAQLPQTKALAIAKRKAKEATEIQIKALLENAQAAAKAVIANSLQVKNEAEALRALVKQELATAPPRWLANSGYAFRRYDHRWELQLIILFKIETFDIEWSSPIKKYSWPAISRPARPIRLWVPVEMDGSYSPTAIKVAKEDPCLPHIKHGGACMGLANAPQLLTGAASFERLKYSLEICHSRVQLDSIYTPFVEISETFKESVPEILLKTLNKKNRDGEVNWNTNFDTLTRRLNGEVLIEDKEENYTWQA